MKKYILNRVDMNLINEVCEKKNLTEEEVYSFSREKILKLTELLSELIGYDPKKDDIDDIGEMADNTITKLLKILELRNEM